MDIKNQEGIPYHTDALFLLTLKLKKHFSPFLLPSCFLEIFLVVFNHKMSLLHIGCVGR